MAEYCFSLTIRKTTSAYGRHLVLRQATRPRQARSSWLISLVCGLVRHRHGTRGLTVSTSGSHRKLRRKPRSENAKSLGRVGANEGFGFGASSRCRSRGSLKTESGYSSFVASGMTSRSKVRSKLIFFPAKSISSPSFTVPRARPSSTIASPTSPVFWLIDAPSA